jgi:hypothetical protein
MNGWVRTDFIRAREAAGLGAIRFHDLRHTAATQLRRLGRDLQIVQQVLGHKTIRTTMRYSHVHPTELREAVNKLGEKLSQVRLATSQLLHNRPLRQLRRFRHQKKTKRICDQKMKVVLQGSSRCGRL